MMTDNSLVLVTDISGYVASHVASVLQRAGYRVRGTVPNHEVWGKIKWFFQTNNDPGISPIEIVEASITNETSWRNAAQDCTYVIHNVCPFVHSRKQDDEQSVLTSSVQNAMYVLRACRAAATIQRVILTASTAAIEYGARSKPSDYVHTEEDWSDVSSKDITLYGKAMTLTEEAAWNYVTTLPEEERIELVVLNPGFPIGRALINAQSPNFLLLRDLMERRINLVPRIAFPVVDVGDVALAHLHALSVPQAAGNRHIVVSSTVSLLDIAVILNDAFRQHGYKVSTTPLPDMFAKALGYLEKSMRSIRSQLGKKTMFDNNRMRTVLNIKNPRGYEESVVQMVHSLIRHGVIVRTEQYVDEEGLAQSSAPMNV